MTDLWFTRATLKTGSADVVPLLNTLLTDSDTGEGLDKTHRLLWTLVPEEQRQADHTGRSVFLWRRAPDRDRRPAWYVLGPHPRLDAGFFDVETKPYSPSFHQGDVLSFDLLVHATVDRMVAPDRGRKGRQRRDVVLDAILSAEKADAAAPRARVRQEQGAVAISDWWTAQGHRHGFMARDTELLDYRTVALERQGARKSRAPLLGLARVTGTLEVTDPVTFARKIPTGFGRAKAFGCGLLLLKRGDRP